MTTLDNKVIGASLLVAGTAIGAGMLALPTVTGFAGFIPSTLLFLFYWVFMLFTSFLILEVNLWMEERSIPANMISMAKRTLGPVGETIAWGAYLFLLYALMTAYLAGSGPLVANFIHSLTGVLLPDWAGFIPLLAIFSYFVIMGTASVDYLNRLMMLAMGLLFVLMLIWLFPYIEESKLLHIDFKALPIAVSVAATSFGFHIIIPTLTEYLKRDAYKIRQALVIGSMIPLAIYLIWEVVTLGVLPLYGPDSIESGYIAGSSAAELLVDILNKPILTLFANTFAFFAIVTSFLGASLGLSACIADGLDLRKIKAPTSLVYALTFIPPLLIALIDPRAFISALQYAGVYGVIVLLALLPACMVYRGRYHLGIESAYKAPGGKGTIYLTMLISIALILLELFS